MENSLRNPRLQDQNVPVMVIILHFMNMLKPVNIKNTLNWRRMKYVTRNRVSEEDWQMILEGYAFFGDIRTLEFRVKKRRNNSKVSERIKRNRIIRNPIPVKKEDYGQWVSN